MPTMLSGQRAPHAFHPYTQANSLSSRNRLQFCTDPSAHTPPYCTHDTPSGKNDCAAAIPSLPDLQELVSSMSEAMDSTLAAEGLTCQQNKLQSSHISSMSNPTSLSTSLPAVQTNAESPSPSNELGDSSIHFPNSAVATPDSRDTVQASTPLKQSSQSPNLLHKSPRQSSSSPVQDIVRYLKTWRPPAEYYARRRYQHPSLHYPSRRPTLPSLLEERVTNDGKLVIVCPELAVSTSPRAYRRRIFPTYALHVESVRQRAATQGWDDDSDEDVEIDFSDEDDSVGSDDDFDEAVTPMSSPPSNTTYFLQPLILTKPPGC